MKNKTNESNDGDYLPWSCFSLTVLKDADTN